MVPPLTIVITVSVFFALPLLLSGFPPSTIDGAIHVRWTHHAALQFWNGTAYPRYFPELNSNFGSPSFFYYPPLSTFAAVLMWPFAPDQGRAWYALGWSAALGLVLSGVFMWLLLRNCTTGRWVTVLGALLYVVAPYHLGVDLLDRGANAECWAFALMPLVLLSFRRLAAESHTKEVSSQKHDCLATECAIPATPIIHATMALSALFYCHLLTAIAFAPIAFGYALHLGGRTLKRAMVAGFWAVLLSAAYVLPSTLYWKHISGSENEAFMGGLFRTTFFFPDFQILRPLFTNDAYHQRLLVVFSGQLIIQFICIFSLLLGILPKNQRRTMLFLVIALQFCIGMMLPVSEPLYVLVPALQRLQFAWRFLGPATLVSTIMITTLAIPHGKSLLGSRFLFGLAVAVIVLTAAYVNFALCQRNGLTIMEGWREKTPPIELQVIDAFGEYVPSGGNISLAEQLFEGATNSRPSACILLSGGGQIEIESRTSRHFRLEADSKDGLRLLLHQFWFPGWLAKDLARDEFIAVTRHTESGLLEISIPAGKKLIDLTLSMQWPEVSGLVITTLSASWLWGLIAWRTFTQRQRSSGLR